MQGEVDGILLGRGGDVVEAERFLLSRGQGSWLLFLSPLGKLAVSFCTACLLRVQSVLGGFEIEGPGFDFLGEDGVRCCRGVSAGEEGDRYAALLRSLSRIRYLRRHWGRS